MKLDEFETLLHSTGPPSDVAIRNACRLKEEHGEHAARGVIRRIAKRRRFVCNAAVNPPDKAAWARARARRVEELKDELLGEVAGQDEPIDAEFVLGESEEAELQERLLFQEGAAFVLNLLEHIFPDGCSSETKLEFMEVHSTAMDDHLLALFGFK